MNVLPNQINVPAGGAGHVVVSLIVTETAVLGSETYSAENELPLERALHRRADAMTDTLSDIMDRPLTPRFWGLNE